LFDKGGAENSGEKEKKEGVGKEGVRRVVPGLLYGKSRGGLVAVAL